MAAPELLLPPPLTSRFLALFHQASRIIITVHRYPDEDALGSALALKLALDRQKPAFCFCPPPLPSLLSTYRRFCSRKPPMLTPKTLIICCDSHPARTHLGRKIKAARCPVITIDHHPKSRSSNLDLIFPSASSTSEIVTRLLVSLNLKISPLQASLLLSGLVLDCGFFQYPNTSALTLQAAAHLVSLGAHPASIHHLVKARRKPVDYKIKGLALRRLQINAAGAGLSVITRKDLRRHGASYRNLNGVASYLGGVPQLRYVLLLTEFASGRVKGSLRTFSAQEMNLRLLAKSFGGGGHQRAAGFKVRGSITKKGKHWQIAPAQLTARRSQGNSPSIK